jgi:nicotinate-nucleotide adenylyltransferase
MGAGSIMDLSHQVSRAIAINRDKQLETVQACRTGDHQHKYRLGIMGGTFDPIHYGHLVTAETSRWKFGLDKVVFMPTGQPPHKPDRIISAAEHRYRMSLLATFNNAYFLVSRLEIDRPGYSYTIDTVKEILRQVGPHVDLFFITGADAVLEILSWKNVQELVELCTFIAANRPGFDLSEPSLSGQQPKSLIQQIKTIEVPSLAISSTEIRHRIIAGHSIRYLLPESVEEYIKRHQLYRDGINID